MKTIEDVLRKIGETAAKRAIGEMDMLIPMHRTESPIEQAFLAAVIAEGEWAGVCGITPAVRTIASHAGETATPEILDEIDCCTATNHIVAVLPQVNIGSYRVDFLFRVEMKNKPPLRIVVECDGHDFHERTKEQAARDRARDRFLSTAGYTVMRFTGSEIWKDANKCARQVIEFMVMESVGALVEADMAEDRVAAAGSDA